MRVLIIDDSETVRALIRRMLAERAVIPDEAGDGLAAMELLAAKGAADVALVDWNMPRMNGLEFVEQVRRDRAYDGMRLLMVTTENDIGRIATALQAGANEYLMKPFSAEDLWSKLDLADGGL